MRLHKYLALAAVIGFTACSSTRGQGETIEGAVFPELAGPYLGQRPAGTMPVLFAPGIVSTDLHDDASPAFTPDGKEVFFRCIGNGQMIILHMSMESGRWSEPEVAPFSGEYRDLGVFLSQDGRRLFFSSDRPVSSLDTTGDLDLFVVDRTDDGWSEPSFLFPRKERSGDMLGCSIDSAGAIYGYARYPEGCGGYDIYRFRPDDGVYSRAELLPRIINTQGDETCPCVARDGSFLIYSKDRGPAGDSAPGLHVSFQDSDHSWTQPINLTKHLGMTLPAKFAGLSPDSRYLFFVVPESREANRRLGRKWQIDALRGAEPGHGGGNVYWVDASVLEDLRPGR